jgi:photosystem II stability/assembly factor-like uncharacterized protein
MKKFFLLSLCLILSLSSYAQWDSCGVTNNNSNPQIEAMDAFIHFNGRLFVHNFMNGMQYSDDYGQSWDTIAQGRFSGVPVSFYTVDQKLYTSTLVSGAVGGVQYYSSDNGSTWTEDTAGMPGAVINPSFKANVIKAAQMGDYIFYQFRSPTQFYWRHKDSTTYHPDNFANTNFMHGWHFEQDTIWASIGQQVYYLSQARGNYVACPNNNLNNAFSGIIYKNGAYIYMPTRDANLDWILCRSNDNGANWDTVYLQNLLGSGSFGATRGVNSIYAQGNQVWMGPGSKGSGTTCEIFYSNDAGSTWTIESQNLPEDPFGTYAVVKFVNAGGYMFAQMAFKDIYRKAFNIGLPKRTASKVKLYPNPSQGVFRIESSLPVAKVLIYDLRGNTLKEYHRMNSYSVRDLRSGVYQVKIQLEGGKILHQNLLVP